MTNVIEKHSISFELAQTMVNEAVMKARELGVTENVAILDDGGNLKAFSRSQRGTFSTLSKATRRFWLASHACTYRRGGGQLR
jgi:uncharacterized protein GlcG (DUF336 family)